VYGSLGAVVGVQCRSLRVLVLAPLLLVACDTSPTCASLCDRQAACGEMVADDCVGRCEEALEPFREHEECAEAIDAVLVCQDMALASCGTAECTTESSELASCRSGDTMRCQSVCEAAAGGSCEALYLGLGCEAWCLGTPLVAADRGCEAELEAQVACIESSAAGATCGEDCEAAFEGYLACFQQYCVDNPDDPDC